MNQTQLDPKTFQQQNLYYNTIYREIPQNIHIVRREYSGLSKLPGTKHKKYSEAKRSKK